MANPSSHPSPSSHAPLGAATPTLQEQTLFLEHAKEGNLESIKHGLNVLGAHANTDAAFVHAARGGHVAVMQYLDSGVESGVMSEVKEAKKSWGGVFKSLKTLFVKPRLSEETLEKGWVAACQNGKLGAVQYLMSHHHLNVEPGLLAACSNAHLNIVTALLENEKNKHLNLAAAFKAAWQQGHARVASHLMAQHDLSELIESEGEEMLWESIASGHGEMVLQLLSHPGLSHHAHQALERAVSQGSLEVLRVLIEFLSTNEGTRQNAGPVTPIAHTTTAVTAATTVTPKSTLPGLPASPEVVVHMALLMACRTHHVEVVKYLLTSAQLKAHADVHAHSDEALRVAFETNSTKVVDYLLYERKMDVDMEMHRRVTLNKGAFEKLMNVVELRDLKMILMSH